MQADEKRDIRVLRRLAGPAGAAAEDADAVERLIRRGLIARQGDRVALTALGEARLRRHLAGADGFAAQHQCRVPATVNDAVLGQVGVTVNDDESPLSRLRRVKGRDGRPLIGAAEFAAGERLRADFTRSQLMPRVTANWTASVAGGRRDGSSGGMAEMTDAVVAARQRVDRALSAVGPDFAGLLLDFCCFLKGIEEIERDRSWPARSAKLVIRLALSSLARHFGLAETALGPCRGGRILHWGAEGYRPEIDPGGGAVDRS
jgi:hypothetical protein